MCCYDNKHFTLSQSVCVSVQWEGQTGSEAYGSHTHTRAHKHTHTHTHTYTHTQHTHNSLKKCNVNKTYLATLRKYVKMNNETTRGTLCVCVCVCVCVCQLYVCEVFITRAEAACCEDMLAS